MYTISKYSRIVDIPAIRATGVRESSISLDGVAI